jgi:hypothetical protein
MYAQIPKNDRIAQNLGNIKLNLDYLRYALRLRAFYPTTTSDDGAKISYLVDRRTVTVAPERLHSDR